MGVTHKIPVLEKAGEKILWGKPASMQEFPSLFMMVPQHFLGKDLVYLGRWYSKF